MYARTGEEREKERARGRAGRETRGGGQDT